MKKVAILVILVLLMGIAAAACGGGGGAVDITDQELIEGILASIDAQETCRFEIDLDGSLEGTVEGEHGEMQMTINQTGAIDIPDREMQAEISMTTDTRVDGQQQEMTIPIRMYFLGDTGYIGAPPGPGEPEEWIKGAVSQELWEPQELLSQQIELIRGAEVKLLKTESVKGIPCYVAEISPDMDALFEVIRWQLRTTGDFGLTKDSISGYSAKGWYAKDTFFPMRSHVEYDVSIEVGSDTVTGSYKIDMLFYDYNKPVSIQLPSEAQNAQDVGSLDWYLQ